ncbi:MULTISPECIES: hypothetical protein [unclassified Streptomyces]|uniref:hypothetical protein n=1 Tax=unclassified Streptomyces TaxID=2593676 RepID=UPI0033313823
MNRIARALTLAAAVAALLSPVAVEAYQANHPEQGRVTSADGVPTDTSWGWGGVQPKLQ